MKTIKKNLFATVLMSALCTGFGACNEPKDQEQSDEPEVIGVSPVSTPEVPGEVIIFFEEALSPFLHQFFDEHHHREQVCLTINSTNELNAITPSSIELPYIDFDNYTLVIGQYFMAAGVYIKSRSIDTKPDIMKLNLVSGVYTGNVLGVMNWTVYCDLYPKLPQKPIAFNVK